MASKTIAWADQSGDVITMTAPAWSGSQTVTLSTPENFGIARELNIVFYSESNPAVSATLNVKQAEATLALSETSLVFASDDTSEKTVTVTTNMSTLDGAQLTLEGDTASDFTLSELSALSNGQATFTIKPNSANDSQDPRNVTIKLTAGRLTPLSLPVTQDADAIQSVTYKDLKLTFIEGTLNGVDISSGGTITAEQAVRPLSTSLKFLLSSTKVTTYPSGRISEEPGTAMPNRFVYFSIDIQSDPKDVFDLILGDSDPEVDSDSEGYITIDDHFHAQMRSTVLWPSQQAKLYVRWHDASGITAEDSVVLNSPTFTVQENKRESYDDFEYLELPPVVCSKNKGSLGYGSVQISGTCHYTSGATQYENVPLSFSVSMGGEFFKIIDQTKGNPGTEPSKSTFTVETLLENTEVPKIYGMADVVAPGGVLVDGIQLVQKGKYGGTLQLRNTAFNRYYYSITLEFNDIPTSARTLRSDEFSVLTELNAIEIPGEVLYKYWKGIIEASYNSQVKVTVEGASTSNPTYIGTLTSWQKNQITQGGDATVSVRT